MATERQYYHDTSSVEKNPIGLVNNFWNDFCDDGALKPDVYSASDSISSKVVEILIKRIHEVVIMPRIYVFMLVIDTM